MPSTCHDDKSDSGDDSDDIEEDYDFCKPSSICRFHLVFHLLLKQSIPLVIWYMYIHEKKTGRLVDMLQGVPAKFTGNCSYIYLVLMHNRIT